MAWLAHQRLGYNYRMSEINAALGVVQISRLDEILEQPPRGAPVHERLMNSRFITLPTLTATT